MYQGQNGNGANQIHDPGWLGTFRINDGDKEEVVTPETNTFTRPVGTPEKASNTNGKKFLPVNTDPSNRVKGVLGEPVALKPLTTEVPTITKRPRGVGK